MPKLKLNFSQRAYKYKMIPQWFIIFCNKINVTYMILQDGGQRGDDYNSA